MKKTSRTIQTKRPRLALIILLLIAAIALFFLKNSPFNNKIDKDSASSESSTSQLPSAAPEQTVFSTANSVQTGNEVVPVTPAAPPPAIDPCQTVSDDLRLFFQHLDSQEYIKAYDLNKPIQNVLSDIIAKLLSNPPVNVNEKADIVTVVKNSAHLYRILGGKDLSLLKDILTREQPTIEQRFASFYAWSTVGKGCLDKSSIKIQLPLAKTYEYAAFFLNTLGGQSYLLRRDATVRVLARYYCVLILNQAVKQSINKYNISLPYHLGAVSKEISSSDFLENQALYLETLQKIKAGH